MLFNLLLRFHNKIVTKKMKNYLRIYFYYNNNVKMLSELIALFRGIIFGGAADLIEVWIL